MADGHTHEVDRLVLLEGATNFRDVGGYLTTSGHSVRRGLVFRSDALQDLTPDDIARLLALGLGEVLDLRSARELEAFGGTPLTQHGVEWHHVGFFPEAEPGSSAAAPVPVPTPSVHDHAAFAEQYLAWLERGTSSVRRAFTEIAEADTHAVVFHCTAGRDRTGLIAGLLLSLVGVDDEVIAADYQLTEQYLRFPEARLERMRAVFGPGVAVSTESPPTPAAVMRITLAGLRERYGSPAAYLADAGVAPEVTEAIRHRLLV